MTEQYNQLQTNLIIEKMVNKHTAETLLNKILLLIKLFLSNLKKQNQSVKTDDFKEAKQAAYLKEEAAAAAKRLSKEKYAMNMALSYHHNSIDLLLDRYSYNLRKVESSLQMHKSSSNNINQPQVLNEFNNKTEQFMKDFMEAVTKIFEAFPKEGAILKLEDFKLSDDSIRIHEVEDILKRAKKFFENVLAYEKTCLDEFRILEECYDKENKLKSPELLMHVDNYKLALTTSINQFEIGLKNKEIQFKAFLELNSKINSKISIIPSKRSIVFEKLPLQETAIFGEAGYNKETKRQDVSTSL